MCNPSDRAPILSRDLARSILFERKARGERVVFTNGCFDIMHPGHMEVLEQAASMGDILVVGINTDDSVKRLKGSSRPVQDLESRAGVLSCIRFVDYVIPFDEDTPAELIALLQPHVLVKGGDYTPETVVGADTVLKGGGSVRIVPLLKGHSTTGLLGE